MTDEHGDSTTERQEAKPIDPENMAREMLASGFTKPIVIDALVAEGVERDQARDIVTDWVKASFRTQQAQRVQETHSQAWTLMGVGVAIMLVGGIPIINFMLKLANEGEAYFSTLWWWILTGGFFVFLFGFTQRKRP